MDVPEASVELLRIKLSLLRLPFNFLKRKIEKLAACYVLRITERALVSAGVQAIVFEVHGSMCQH